MRGVAYKNKRFVAIVELLIACNFWGFGFVATIWVLEGFTPFWFTALRFLIAFFCALPLLLSQKSLRTELNWKNIFYPFVPGLFLSATLVLQTWGLQYTTATKSGFITCLYVVLVPIGERYLFGRPFSFLQAIYILIALIGTALIANFTGATSLNFGDFLTLLCAVAAAFHIMSVGAYSKKMHSAVLFNSFQSFWSCLIPLGLALGLENFPNFSSLAKPTVFAGFASLTFGSTLIAFMLQIRAQKFINATTASMIFLLESPIAALYAYWILGERLLLSQWIGGLLIVVAAAGSALEQNPEASHTPVLASD